MKRVILNYIAFVEFETDDGRITGKLNTGSSTYEIGQKLEIFYYEGRPETVHKKESDVLLILFPIVGASAVVLGVSLAFNKRL